MVLPQPEQAIFSGRSSLSTGIELEHDGELDHEDGQEAGGGVDSVRQRGRVEVVCHPLVLLIARQLPRHAPRRRLTRGFALVIRTPRDPNVAHTRGL